MNKLLLWVHGHQIITHASPCRSHWKSLAALSTSTASNRAPNNDYHHIEDVEFIDRYCPRGCYLVSIGDRLHGLAWWWIHGRAGTY